MNFDFPGHRSESGLPHGGYMKKDRVFAEKKEKIKPFEFNEQVASVFDDMLTRSVPFYFESITRQAQLCRQFYNDKTLIYDLGCSHGNLGMMICRYFDNKNFKMIGVDNSIPMIKKYGKRLENTKWRENIDLICEPAENIKIINASVVILNLTIQFIAPEKRDDLITGIYNGLVKGGILLLTEKIVHETEVISEIQRKYYTRFKMENGYSKLEISQKRDALEDVLIPETIEVHKHRLTNAGFDFMDVWLKWFNFASFLAIK